MKAVLVILTKRIKLKVNPPDTSIINNILIHTNQSSERVNPPDKVAISVNERIL